MAQPSGTGGDASPRSSIDDIRAYFDTLAPIYADEARAVGWSVNDVVAKRLASMEAPATVLDLACGTGATLEVLRSAFPHAVLTGVDLSPVMATSARLRVPGARIIVGDLAGWVQGASLRFHLVTAVGGLEFVPDLPAVLARLRSTVLPGGQLLFTYEPRIEDPADQSEATSSLVVVPGRVLTTYRWRPDTVVDALAGWDLVAHDMVPAYERDGVPVTYGLVHVQNPGAISGHR
jgi:predicted TPR repeat methyltransferase